MPIGFILLGLFVIFSLFYINNYKTKLLIIIFSILSMIGYFVPNITIKEYSFNMFFLIVAFFITIYLLFYNNNIYLILSTSFATIIIYVIMVQFNVEFVTSLNIFPFVILVGIISLMFINNYKNLLLFYSCSYFLVSLSNLFVAKFLENIVVGEMILFDFMVIELFIVEFISKLFSNFKSIKKESV